MMTSTPDQTIDCLKALPEIIALVGRDLRVRWASERFLEWCGQSREAVEGREILGALRKPYADMIRPMLETARTGEAGSREDRLLLEEDEERRVRISFSPACDGGGGFLLFINDEHTNDHALARSEAKLKLVMNAVPALVSYIDRDGRYQLMNKSYCEWFGLDPERDLGKHVREVIGDEAVERGAPFAEIAMSGKSTRFENLVVDKDGHYRDVEVSCLPDNDENGNTRGFILAAHDVTEMKKVLSDLRKSEERLRFLANVSSALLSSRNSKVGAFNLLERLVEACVPAFADYCLVSVQEGSVLKPVAVNHVPGPEEEAVARIHRTHPLPADLPKLSPFVYRTGTAELYECLTPEQINEAVRDPALCKALNDMGVVSYLSVPMKSRGSMLGVICFFTTPKSGRRYTVSDMRVAEELGEKAALALESSRLYENAQAANRLKDEFLATLSHELRTPIHVIHGNAELLTAPERLTHKELAAISETIRRNARIETQIVDDLLDVSAIVTGKISFKPVTISPSEVVENVRDGLEQSAKGKGIAISADLHQAPRFVCADPTRLQQIVWNLVSNAIKFTERGGRISIRIWEDGELCKIAVSDDGKGIDPAFLPYVFDRFRQEDSSNTRRFGGLGLGLSIVKHLTELHGGTVTVESQGMGKGSCFTVSIPVSHGVGHMRPSAPTSVLTEPGARRSDEPARLDGIKVLLVEDSADARVLVERILKKAGASVIAVGSPSEARQKLHEGRCDLIVSDIGMPDEDGITFLRKLRLTEKSTGDFTPAIALTAYARPEEREAVIGAGFQGHVAKPVATAKLLQTVREVAGLSQVAPH